MWVFRFRKKEGKAMATKVELGSKVRDTVTGLTGTAVAYTKWLNGCERIVIQPPLDKDGKVPDSHSVDIQQIEIVEAVKVEPNAPAKVGGPKPEPRRQPDPVR